MIMDKALIKDYYVPHDNIRWKLELDELALFLSKFSLHFTAPLCTYTFTSKFSIAFLNIRTREN